MAEGAVQAVAQAAGAPNLQDLDDTGKTSEEEGISFFVKEFFWDKIILLLATSIIGLTALDILTELLRGGNGVVCFVPEDLNISEDQSAYVNSFCSRSVPDAQYLPIFVLIHGILVAVWHYIWKSSFSSHFDYFFSLTSHLARFRDEPSGEYPVKNLRIVSRLETEFCTYRKSSLLRWYQVKLVLQLLTAIASILLSFLLFNDFNVDFTCQWRDPSDGTVTEVPCIFASLRLFLLVRIVDTVLLGLIIIVVILAFLWTVVRHTDELNYRNVAKFSFSGAIGPEHYRPKPLLSLNPLTRLFSPQIKNDLEFLLMALYKTDSGLAHIFTEGQVLQEKTRHFESEIRYLSSYEVIDEEKESDEVAKKMAPNWRVKFNAKTTFNSLPIDQSIKLPSDIVGVVMGLGVRAPRNKYAMSIAFGSQGFAPALARVFIYAGGLNFDPDYKDKDEPIKVNRSPANLTTFHCHADILSLGDDQITMFREALEEEVFSREFRLDYIVVGPVAKREHLSTLTKLVKLFQFYFTENAVLLVVVPRAIEGKKTKFFTFQPPETTNEKQPLFSPPLDQSVMISPGQLPWPPTEVEGGSMDTNFTLSCGPATCTFDLKLYKFMFTPEEDDDTDWSEESDDSEEDPPRKEDKSPLLKGATDSDIKSTSPVVLKKQMNADVNIPIEP